MRSWFAVLAVLLLSSALGGCARYEFDVVRPADLAQHVGTKRDAVLPVPPLEYRMRAREGRLVVAIVNKSDRPVTLRGDESFVVDPRGQSHPLRSQTIAPASYGKVVFPPIQPRYAPAGPTFGIGFGTVISSAGPHPRRRYGAGFGDHDSPRYLVAYGDEEAGRYWRWDGETEIRATFVYDHAGERLEHEFVVRRKRM